MRKVEVFLCVDVSLDQLPEQYEKAIEKFSHLDPEILCLPWPETVIPPVGSTVRSNSLPLSFDECIVSKVEYFFYEEEEKGIRVDVYLEGKKDSSLPPERTLECFADCGFVFFAYWDKPIKEILSEAGLYPRK